MEKTNPQPDTVKTTLFALKKNRPARICGFDAPTPDQQIRLREIGFAEGDLVEILHEGLFGRSPLNIKLHGTAIAMRPSEAKMIRVIPADLHRSMGGELDICETHGELLSKAQPCCGACGDDDAKAVKEKSK